MPVSQDTLLLYVAFLFEQGLSGSTIRVYLSAIRSLHILSGNHYPTDLSRVKLALKGAVRESPQPVRKLPITITILKNMLNHVSTRFDHTLLQAVMTLAFFGCFRLGEICIPDNVKFDCASHLCLGDVTINNEQKSLEVFLKKSKTDSLNTGVTVHVGCSRDDKCCAFCSMVVYMKSRLSLNVSHDEDTPLFLVPGGRQLTKSYMVKATRLLLGLTGHNPALWSVVILIVLALPPLRAIKDSRNGS
jgi:hypothetical protein